MRLERMNSPEVEAYFKDHKIALLSVGSIECHGLHNALGTDTLIPMKLLELVEQKSDVLILPTLPYGDCGLAWSRQHWLRSAGGCYAAHL